MIELTDDEFKILYDLARRTLHTAYVWNDHNNLEQPVEMCRETCRGNGLDSLAESQIFLKKIADKGN